MDDHIGGAEQVDQQDGSGRGDQQTQCKHHR
jgi:hypothetical protein